MPLPISFFLGLALVCMTGVVMPMRRVKSNWEVLLRASLVLGVLAFLACAYVFYRAGAPLWPWG